VADADTLAVIAGMLAGDRWLSADAAAVFLGLTTASGPASAGAGQRKEVAQVRGRCLGATPAPAHPRKVIHKTFLNI